MDKCDTTAIKIKEQECFLGDSAVKNLPASLGPDDPLEKEMTIYFCIFALEIPWTKEPARLKSMESESVRHNLVTKKQENNY